MKIGLILWPIFYIISIIAIFIGTVELFIIGFLGIIITTFRIIFKYSEFFNINSKDKY